MAIRTPDQRIRVFVSSTLEELAEERRAVREAIGSLRMTPVMFEQGARPHPPRALYRAYLEQSDVFVGLYWERYGWIAPGEQTSGLEDEYGLAGDRPKLIYIKSPAPQRQPRLSELIARIQSDDRVSYRHFGSADELRSVVADDLAVLLSERFSPRAPSRSWRLPAVPHPPTRLVGREQDVDRVAELLSKPDTRLITIFGTGGIGKSRLALAVAEQVESRYADGIAFVDLSAVTEPALLLPTVAVALGVEERPGATIAGQLQDRLGAASMLLVLDNVEQLIDAAADLADLMAHTAALQLLVTSRRTLGLRGEHVYELDPLAVPAADGVITPAVELFLDRARAVRPDFEPTGEELAAIAELARRLDGLPLAIELASARLRTLTPRAILELMGHHRLEFLGAGPRDLPARQRTLSVTLDWSFSLLSLDARVLFTRLGVFAGGAGLEAIERVANPSGELNVLDLLAELVDGSLIRPAGEADEPRFGMLGTIREFAVERLEAAGEGGDCLARHQTYFLELAERGSTGLGSAHQLEWLRRLDREIDNFRAVLRRAVRRNDPTIALRMARSLSQYSYMRGAYSEARGWMEKVAALPGADARERAIAWTLGAVEAFLLGDRDVLMSGLDRALELATDEDRPIMAFARLLRAIATGAAPDDVELSQATRQLEADGNPLAIALGLVASASLAQTQGRIMEAQRLAQAGHDLSAQTGDWWVRAYASGQLSIVARELGDRNAARRHAVESLVAARRLGNRSASGDALGLWAMAEFGDGRIEEAGRLWALAEAVHEQAGHGRWRSDPTSYHRFSAELKAALGDRYDRALAEAQRAGLEDEIAELVGAYRPNP